MVQSVLPYLTPVPSPQRYLDDLHSPPSSAPFATPPSPADLAPSDLELLKRRALRLAGTARESLPAFFQFVFRDETLARARIQTAAHQRLLFEFVRHYNYCVIRLPTNFSKTYCMTADLAFALGRNVAMTSAFIGAAESQSEKPLGMIRSLIEESPELRLVFPGLVPTERDGEPWTQTAITVRRPFGIRDPSVLAVGLDSKRLPGARLDQANVDDILDMENTATADSRKKVIAWIKNTVVQRLRTNASRCVFTNTPWHPEDATYALEDPKGAAWPSLNMDCWGGIWFKNADDFDSVELRPTKAAADEELETGVLPNHCRLAAHDAPAYRAYAIPRVADNSAVDDKPAMEPRGSIDSEWVPLWPARFDTPALLKERKKIGGGAEWARTKELKTRSDEDSRVQSEWIEKAKQAANARGFYGPLPRWTDGAAYTGVDLAFSKKKKSDNVVVFSFAVLADMRRLILGVDVGKWKGKEILSKVRSHHDRFESIVTIESNAAQRLLREWGLDLDISMRLRDFETNKNKHAPEFGVESLFLELENGAWLIPCDHRGRVDPDIQVWIDDCLNYKHGGHTGDALMASWMAREQARLSGALRKGKDFWGVGGGSFAGITSR